MVRRVLLVIAVLVLLASPLLSLAGLSSAEAGFGVVLISEDSFATLIILNLLSLAAIVVLALILWQGSRNRTRV